MSRFYVYELIDPRCGSVFYVGKGQRNRIDAHEREARKGKRSKKCDRIRSIEAAGLQVLKQKASLHHDEAEAYLAEAELVSIYGLENLTNSLPGGQGAYSVALEELRRRAQNRPPTEGSDRALLRQAIPLWRRTRKLLEDGVTVLNVLDLASIEVAPIMEMLNKTLAKIAGRRSIAWMNEIASAFKVEFQAGLELN